MFNFGKKTGLGAILIAAIGIGAPATLGFEGMELLPYYDSVGVRTVCAGETNNVEERQYTEDECVDMFEVQYGYYSYSTARFYNTMGQNTVTPEIHAAMTDMSYNVGLSAVKRSTMIRELNKGNAVKACDAILSYDRASTPHEHIDILDGKKDGRMTCSKTKGYSQGCYGIWIRRQKMHELCMKGVNNT